MRAVMLQVPRHLLEERRRLGHDRRDEVWDGVLHMALPPHAARQRLNDKLGFFFQLHWQRLDEGRTFPATGVKRPGVPPHPELGPDVPSDYRTPDRSFLLPERYERVQGGWIVGGPDVVLEVLSPGDEARAKLPFYFELDVREVLLIDRDTRAVQVLRRGPAAFEVAPPDGEGWHTSEVLGTGLRREEGPAGPRLHLRRLGADPARELVIEPV